jgi:hypothetical protein
MNKINKLILFLLLLLPAQINASVLADDFVDIKLNDNISFQLPRNWVVISDNGLTRLNSVIKHSIFTISTVRFQANLKNEDGEAVTTLQLYGWDSKSNQNQISKWSQYEVQNYDLSLLNQFQKEAAQVGTTISSWYGTKVVQINGTYALESRYKRPSQFKNGNFIVHVLRVYAGKNSFSFVISYHEQSTLPLGVLVDEIISTLRCGNCNY